MVLLFVLMFTCIGCDQVTKYVAVTSLQDASPKIYLNDTIRIQFATNTGAFLGLGSWLSEGARFWIFNVFTGCVVLGMLAYLVMSHRMKPWETVAFALLVSGGLGNLIDRVFRGGIVIDFMNLGIGKLRTGIFNVADVAIMAGIFLLLALKLFEKDEEGAVGNAEV
jgi:signal peptidase II